MAIKVKNIATGEVKEVVNTGLMDGKLFVFGKNEPTRWAAKYEFFKLTGNILASGAYNKYEIEFVDGIGYELCAGTPTRTRKAKVEPKVAEPKVEPQVTPAPERVEVKEEPTPTEKVQPVDNVDATAMMIAQALQGLKVQQAPINREELQKIISEEVERISSKMRKMEFEVKSERGTFTVEGVQHHKFQDVCTLIANGVDVYLYGPAGTGKSDLAANVGKALGLQVYQIGAVKDVYQLRGYGDASGNYVPSSFYHAFTEGGLLIIDEADAMDSEASLELNGAMAQRTYDFPIVGNKNAHKDFHVIMTGNTCGTGATEEYTGRQMLDAALLNRVFLVEIDYDRNIEEEIAGEEMKDVVDFVHDLRDAAKAANILIVVSYRNIKQLRQLCNVVGIDTLIQGCITKGMGKDEINILYNGLNDKYSRWAKALKKAA